MKSIVSIIYRMLQSDDLGGLLIYFYKNVILKKIDEINIQ